MTHARDVVRDFYNTLSAGDAPGVLGLMAPDVERTTMWHYKADGGGSDGVAEGLFKPLMAEWSRFSLVPTEFISKGETVALAVRESETLANNILAIRAVRAGERCCDGFQ